MHEMTSRRSPFELIRLQMLQRLPTTGLMVATVLLGACGGGGGNTVTTVPPSMQISGASIGEGNSGNHNLQFTVTLSAAAGGDVTVDYTTGGGTAIANSDYAPIRGTLTIPAGATKATINVAINGDTLFEPNETLGMTLSNASGATIAVAKATGLILNDDAGAGNMLNDTGVDTWGDGSRNDITAAQSAFPGQDADTGRDAATGMNSNADGRLGFSFTKLDANGVALVDQSASYTNTPWDCVVDNVTGLMWEVKTPKGRGGLRDAGYTYTWYNSHATANGGNVGTPNGGICNDTMNCDTEKYVAAVNRAGLCGYKDWRMPTHKELRSILDYGIQAAGLTIDANFFPNTINGFYWTATPQAGNALGAWTTVFSNAGDMAAFKSDLYNVRLVRGGR